MIEMAVTMPRLFAEGAGTLDLQLTLSSGSLTAIVGPSGAGKTTLLRLLAGLETPQAGRIRVNGVCWLDTQNRLNLPPQQRSIGYVFQDTALFPNMTVRQNISYAVQPSQAAFADELLDRTGLLSFANQKPGTLSGGQRQRVALARALVRKPAILLLDEPFAALDAVAGQALREVLRTLHQTWQTTTLLVSHYDIEVRALADRVVQVVQGKIAMDRLLTEAEPFSERIERIYRDPVSGQWIVETATVQLRSSRPELGKLNIGDFIRVG